MSEIKGLADAIERGAMTTNEPAERLREDLRERYGSAGLVDEALAAERLIECPDCGHTQRVCEHFGGAYAFLLNQAETRADDLAAERLRRELYESGAWHPPFDSVWDPMLDAALTAAFQNGRQEAIDSFTERMDGIIEGAKRAERQPYRDALAALVAALEAHRHTLDAILTPEQADALATARLLVPEQGSGRIVPSPQPAGSAAGGSGEIPDAPTLTLDEALRALVAAWDLEPPDLFEMDAQIAAARRLVES